MKSACTRAVGLGPWPTLLVIRMQLREEAVPPASRIMLRRTRTLMSLPDALEQNLGSGSRVTRIRPHRKNGRRGRHHGPTAPGSGRDPPDALERYLFDHGSAARDPRAQRFRTATQIPDYLEGGQRLNHLDLGRSVAWRSASTRRLTADRGLDGRVGRPSSPTSCVAAPFRALTTHDRPAAATDLRRARGGGGAAARDPFDESRSALLRPGRSTSTRDGLPDWLENLRSRRTLLSAQFPVLRRGRRRRRRHVRGRTANRYDRRPSRAGSVRTGPPWHP
jgi:hypothetical protein